MSALTDIVTLGISAAEKLTPEEIAIQLKAYGLAVDELSAAASPFTGSAVIGYLLSPRQRYADEGCRER